MRDFLGNYQAYAATIFFIAMASLSQLHITQYRSSATGTC